MPTTLEKVCTKCLEPKPATSKFFSVRKSGSLQSWCRGCVTKYQRAWLQANPEKTAAYGEKWVRSNPEKVKAKQDRRQMSRAQLLRVTKSRAKKKGIPFDLEPDDLIYPDLCPYLGIPLKHHLGEGCGPKDDSPSLDRIDPSKGYVRTNVEIISHRANMIKNCGTAEEHEKIAARMRTIGT
jgi:hypothetical protein